MAENNRPSKKDYYLEIAKAVARRSTCLRRQYGAVIVKDDQIISTGYNGSARGDENCCDAGECWRSAHGIPHGEQYEKCVAVHAEANAILSADRAAMIGATLYLAGFEDGRLLKATPCAMCARLIKNARIAEVIGTDSLPVFELPNNGVKYSEFAPDRFCKWILCKIKVPDGNPDDLLEYPVYFEDGREEQIAFIAFGKLDDSRLIAYVNPKFFLFSKSRKEYPFNLELVSVIPSKITIASHTYHKFVECVMD